MDFKATVEINQNIEDIHLEKTVRELVNCHNSLNQSCIDLNKRCMDITKSCMDNFQKIASMLDKLEKRICILEDTVRQNERGIYQIT